MNNLKRVLSLGLASSMLSGLVTMGTSAANIDTFTDASKIVHTDAVNTMVAINVINGKDDGSFSPSENVTREQMASMITKVMNGGRDYTYTAKDTPTFSDIKGRWSEGFIEYCVTRGIISGRGDGTFGPTDNVTGSSAAKMLLVAMGYNATKEGMTNSPDWEVNINALGVAKGLYDDLGNTDPTKPLTRENAAQMIYNACNAAMVEYKAGITVNPDGTIGGSVDTATDRVYNAGESNNGVVRTAKETLLHANFNIESRYAYMTDISYDSDRGDYRYTFATYINEDNDKPQSDKSGNIGEAITNEFLEGDMLSDKLTSKEDYSNLFGQRVRILYKNDTDNTVCGIFASKSKVLATGIADNLNLDDIKKDNQIKIDGTAYKLEYKYKAKYEDTDARVNVYAFNEIDNVVDNTYPAGTTELYSFAEQVKAKKSPKYYYYNMALIDNNDNNKVDAVVIYPTVVAKVTYVGSESITVNNTSYKYDDCDIYDGISRNDWVVLTDAKYTANDTTMITEAEVVSGELDAKRSSDPDEEDKIEIRLDGTWYTDKTGNADKYKISDEYDVAVVNGFAFNYEQTKSGATSRENVLFTKDVDSVSEGFDDVTQKIKALFADGTEKTVKVEKIMTTNNQGEEKKVKVSKDNVEAEEHTIYSYSINSNGYYELTEVKTYEDEDYDKVGIVSASTDDETLWVKGGKVSTTENGMFRFADDAVIFVKTITDYGVVSGATLNDWNDQKLSKDQWGVLFADKTDGFYYTVLGSLNLDLNDDVPGVKGDEKYGWITSNASVIRDGDDYYAEVNIWDGEEEFTARVESVNDGDDIDSGTLSSTQKKALEKGPISYKALGDDHVKEVVSLKGTEGAITAYDGNKTLSIQSKGKLRDAKIVDDTVILYVETENNKGIEGGSITTANEVQDEDNDDKVYYVKNCYAEWESETSDDLKYLIVDTMNNLDSNKSAGLDKNGVNIKIGEVENGQATITLGENVTLTKDELYDLNSTGSKDGKVIVNGWIVKDNFSSDNSFTIVGEDGKDYIKYTIK